MKQKLFRDKVLGAWLGKAIGGTLGAPHEGNPCPMHLDFYNPVPTEMMPNDDLDLQVLWLCKLATDWHGVVSRRNFERAWLDCVEFPWDEYGVCLRNLKLGIHAPYTGIYDNWFKDGLGAAIRSEVWACLVPGNPELAAQYAYEDACLDHVGDGLYAEQFLAAVESAAFEEDDLCKLIEIGLSVIPKRSCLASAIRDTVRWCETLHDPIKVRAKIMAKYGSANFTDVKMNLPFEVMALLLGGGDFGKSICLAVNCGQDTDCTGATVGSIMGILNPAGIPAKWLSPIGRDLVVSKEITGINPPASLDDFTDLLLQVQPSVRLEPAPDEKFDASGFGILAKVWQQGPWFYKDYRRFAPQPISAVKHVILPGNVIDVDFGDLPNASQLVIETEFLVDGKSPVKIFANTPAFIQVYVDGKFCFERERGDFVPAIHRTPANQICTMKLKAGRHTLTMALGKNQADMLQTQLVFGIGDMKNFWQIPDAFRKI